MAFSYISVATRAGTLILFSWPHSPHVTVMRSVISVSTQNREPVRGSGSVSPQWPHSTSTLLQISFALAIVRFSSNFPLRSGHPDKHGDSGLSCNPPQG